MVRYHDTAAQDCLDMIGTIADSERTNVLPCFTIITSSWSDSLVFPANLQRFLARPDPFLRNKLQHLDLE